MNEVPEPVTFASGVPEPHCAVAREVHASIVVRMVNRTIVAMLTTRQEGDEV